MKQDMILKRGGKEDRKRMHIFNGNGFPYYTKFLIMFL
jgi:hypothetical protein